MPAGSGGLLSHESSVTQSRLRPRGATRPLRSDHLDDIRLVPGAPVPHAGQVTARLKRIRVIARVPRGNRARELPEGGRTRLPGPRLYAAGAPGALGPGRRAEDVEEDVQPTRRGVARRRVAGAPVVAGVCRI